MYWNRGFREVGDGRTGWLITLDVLKFKLGFISKTTRWSWLITLDVLKFSYYGGEYSKAKMLINNIRCIEILKIYIFFH